MLWEASTGDDFIPSGSWSQDYTGIEVRPHPAMQILLDQKGRVESSHADLALILLQTPVERKYTPLRLADEEVLAGETFVLVGGTSDEFQGRKRWGDRVFMRYKAVQLMGPESDRVLFDQPKRELFKGDSGGPCIGRTKLTVLLWASRAGDWARSRRLPASISTGVGCAPKSVPLSPSEMS